MRIQPAQRTAARGQGPADPIRPIRGGRGTTRVPPGAGALGAKGDPRSQDDAPPSGAAYVFHLSPVVASVIPNLGPIAGGTTVAVVAPNAVPGATATLAGLPLTGVEVGDRVLSGTTPAHPSGIVDLTLTNPSGLQATRAGAFTYTLCPTTPLCFTDEPLVAGATVIKALHLQELRDRVNADLHAYGFPARPWTDATLTPGASPVAAQDLLELRGAVTFLYSIPQDTPPSYAHPLLPGSPIRAADIEELRALLVAFETERGIVPR